MNNQIKQRYIYAVTRELPQAQRPDIEKELHGLIEDMLEERTQNRPATDKDLEDVLYELGKPQDSCGKIQGSKTLPDWSGSLPLLHIHSENRIHGHQYFHGGSVDRPGFGRTKSNLEDLSRNSRHVYFCHCTGIYLDHSHVWIK